MKSLGQIAYEAYCTKWDAWEAAGQAAVDHWCLDMQAINDSNHH